MSRSFRTGGADDGPALRAHCPWTLAGVLAIASCRGVSVPPSSTEGPEATVAVRAPAAPSTSAIECDPIEVNLDPPGVKATLSMSVLVEGPSAWKLHWSSLYQRGGASRLPAPWWEFVGPTSRRLLFRGAHEGDARGGWIHEYSYGVMDLDTALDVLGEPPVVIRLYGRFEAPLGDENRARLLRFVGRIREHRPK